MAGNISLSVDHIFGGETQQQRSQAIFVTVYNFLNTHWTRIASNFGTASGGLDGTGFNYYDAGSGHAGENAWAVFRTNGNSLPPYNVIISWAVSNNFANWTIGNSNAVDGVAIGGAILDTGSDAWNGTMNNDGSDTVGSPRWNIGAASVLFTFSNQNEPGGSRTTNKEDLFFVKQVTATGDGSTLLHMWIDDDNFMSWTDGGNSNVLNSQMSPNYIGEYIPFKTTFALPIMSLNELASISSIQTDLLYGSGSTRVCSLLASDLGTPQYHFDARVQTMLVSSVGVGGYVPTELQDGKYPATGLLLVARSGNPGPVGIFNHRFMKLSMALPVNSIGIDSNDKRVLYIGNGATGVTSTNNYRMVVPWHEAGIPGSNLSRTGYQFTIVE